MVDNHLGVGGPETLLDRVRAAWRDVLDRDEIDVDADFFALGVESLQAVRLVAELEERFDVELDVMLVFDAPTVRAMSVRLAELLGERGTTGLSGVGDRVDRG